MPDAERLGWGAVRYWRWRWIVLVTVLVALPIIVHFSRIHVVDWVIHKQIYKNVASPLDEELPVTVTAFPSSINMVSTIGGMGEGLSCSLPWFADYFFEKDVSRIAVRQRFRQACVFHDLCYRHGLATYGYTQNDCDDLLQEQALRICISVSRKPSLTDCRIDAKKVAAGVKLGGFKDYRNWDRSTFFEFDPNPYRSTRFFVTRAIDDPFKARDPDRHRNDPDQLLMMFHIQRGGVGRSCINCGERKMAQNEVVSAGPEMSSEEPVWLPPGRFYSAPHIAADGDGGSKLVWVLRLRLETSESCVAVTDAMKVLTGTLPKMSGCYKNANPRLGLAQVDLLSSSPQFSMVSSTPPDPRALPSIVVSGLTAQRGANLHICNSGDMREGLDPGSDGTCIKIRDFPSEIQKEDKWGAFQNFPIVRGDRHIYLLRTMLPGQGKAAGGSIYPLVLDVMNNNTAGSSPTELEPLPQKTLNIGEKYDPIMPIATERTDMRLMSVHREKETLDLSEIDLGLPTPELEPIKLSAVNGGETKDIVLHRSWAHRPSLVLESPALGADKKTQLVISRSKVTTRDRKDQSRNTPVDSVQLEFAILERPAARGGEKTFRLVRGFACSVSYTVTKPHPIQLCRRAAMPPHDTELATPATRLQGAQLLMGRFASGGSALTLALFDRCYPNSPIIFGDSVVPKELELSSPHVERRVKCGPLGSVESMAKEMATP